MRGSAQKERDLLEESGISVNMRNIWSIESHAWSYIKESKDFLVFSCWVFVLCMGYLESSSCSVKACHRGSFFCCRAWALGHVGPAVLAHELSCSTTWDLPGWEIKPMSPALAGARFTIEPPGKPWTVVFNNLSVPNLLSGELLRVDSELRIGWAAHSLKRITMMIF